MGLLQEQRVLLTVLEWCGFVYCPSPMHGACRRKWTYRLYCVRAGAIVVCLLTLASCRVREILQYVEVRSVSYVMWLTAVILETVVVVVLQIANGINVPHFTALWGLMERLERSVETNNMSGSAYPPYGLVIGALMVLCSMYHLVLAFYGYVFGISMLLQLRLELLIAELYAFQLVFLLLAVGRLARGLRLMLHDAIASNCVTDVYAVLRMRDDLVHTIVLINRYYAVFFFGSCASWVLTITGILYFDFVSGGVFVLDAPTLWLHASMLVWKSSIIGGLLLVAGSVTQRVKQVTQAIARSEMNPSNDRALAKMIEKALLKCQFQDSRFTAYGLFTIDNSLSYTVICSIVTYLVILVQFRQLEENNE